MNKTFLKRVSAIIIAAIMSVPFCIETQVDATTNEDEENFILGGKLIADMTDLKCKYSTEVQTNYGEKTMRGATSWNSAMDPLLAFDVYWRRVLDDSTPTVSVYLASWPLSGLKASTLAYDEIGDWLSVDQETSDWHYCTIHINTAQNPDHTTMAHEFGHVFGLGENNSNPNSIMCQSTDRIATKPSTVDIIAINRIYSGT